MQEMKKMDMDVVGQMFIDVNFEKIEQLGCKDPQWHQIRRFAFLIVQRSAKIISEPAQFVEDFSLRMLFKTKVEAMERGSQYLNNNKQKIPCDVGYYLDVDTCEVLITETYVKSFVIWILLNFHFVY